MLYINRTRSRSSTYRLTQQRTQSRRPYCLSNAMHSIHWTEYIITLTYVSGVRCPVRQRCIDKIVTSFNMDRSSPNLEYRPSFYVTCTSKDVLSTLIGNTTHGYRNLFHHVRKNTSQNCHTGLKYIGKNAHARPLFDFHLQVSKD